MTADSVVSEFVFRSVIWQLRKLCDGCMVEQITHYMMPLLFRVCTAVR